MPNKTEKIIIGKGKLTVIKKVITELSKSDSVFKNEMDKLPAVQKLTSHYYLFVPINYHQIVKKKFEELHFEKYGYVD